MKIEWLINDTYQVTDGSTVWFQGSLAECECYMAHSRSEKATPGESGVRGVILYSQRT